MPPMGVVAMWNGCSLMTVCVNVAAGLIVFVQVDMQPLLAQPAKHVQPQKNQHDADDEFQRGRQPL